MADIPKVVFWCTLNMVDILDVFCHGPPIDEYNREVNYFFNRQIETKEDIEAAVTELFGIEYVTNSNINLIYQFIQAMSRKCWTNEQKKAVEYLMKQHKAHVSDVGIKKVARCVINGSIPNSYLSK
jgi:ribosomal protein L23